jgi:FKBP-type peptidyl-prolyl cis-trans isomerase
MTTPALQIEYLSQGAGRAPRPGETVIVHYTGWLTDGTQFDSTRPRGEPFAFVLGRGDVIEGWDLAVAQMRQGDRVRLTLPPELAYGDRSPAPAIPANATLVFEIELLDVRSTQ